MRFRPGALLEHWRALWAAERLPDPPAPGAADHDPPGSRFLRHLLARETLPAAPDTPAHRPPTPLRFLLSRDTLPPSSPPEHDR